MGGALQAQEKFFWLHLVNEKDAFLVDVRSEKEFDQGSALNAVNIPVDKIEKELDQFKGKSNIILFCRAGRRAEAARKLLEKTPYKSNQWWHLPTGKNLAKENLMDRLSYRTGQTKLYRLSKIGEGVKQVAVALGKGAILKKHTTDVPAFLVVVKGEIRFLINGQEILLKALDTYNIPAEIEHELIGVDDENLFILTKSKYFKE